MRPLRMTELAAAAERRVRVKISVFDGYGYDSASDVPDGPDADGGY